MIDGWAGAATVRIVAEACRKTAEVTVAPVLVVVRALVLATVAAAGAASAARVPGSIRTTLTPVTLPVAA